MTLWINSLFVWIVPGETIVFFFVLVAYEGTHRNQFLSENKKKYLIDLILNVMLIITIKLWTLPRPT